MIDEADRDGDGEISEEEFYRIMRKTNLFWAERQNFRHAYKARWGFKSLFITWIKQQTESYAKAGDPKTLTRA